MFAQYDELGEDAENEHRQELAERIVEALEHEIMEDVRHLVEEGELFPKTREGLAAERLEEIGTEMEQEKQGGSRAERRSRSKRSARKSSSSASHENTGKKRAHGS